MDREHEKGKTGEAARGWATKAVALCLLIGETVFGMVPLS
jgi:hypothetical protein